jgi:broad specificity phosphatase PhoE
MLRAFGAACVLIATIGLNVSEAQTIFIARHAERTGEPDPPLNGDGQRRAEALAKLLVDAGVYYFYTTETIRARQTAEPTARQAGRTIEIVEQAVSVEELVARVRKTADPARPTLIVGHRGTVPRIVKALGGGDIPELRADEHDRLIVLTMLAGDKASIVTLRYGQ